MPDDLGFPPELPDNLLKDLINSRPPIHPPGKGSASLSEIEDKLVNIEAKLEPLSPDQLATIRSDIKALQGDLKNIQNYQHGIYQWLVAIGGQVGLKPAEEASSTQAHDVS